MDRVYLPDELDSARLSCPGCQWEGPGDEAVIIDLYGVSRHMEVHCPSCDRFLASLQRDEESGSGSKQDAAWSF